MRKFRSVLIFSFTAVFLVFACARNRNGYGGGNVNNPPPPPPPPSSIPFDVLVSVENSAATAPYLDKIESSLTSFVNTLQPAGYDFRIGLLRSTENADGNYDSRLVGPQTVVVSSDAQPGAEIDQNMKTLRAAFVGSIARPANIVAEAILDGRNSGFFRPGVIRLHFLFSLTDDYSAFATYYGGIFGQAYQPPSWSVHVFGPNTDTTQIVQGGAVWTLDSLNSADYVGPMMGEVARYFSGVTH